MFLPKLYPFFVILYIINYAYLVCLQARPRRRSGEAIGPQDLSKAPSPSSFNNNVAENLSMKKSPNNENINNDNMPTDQSCNNKMPDRTPSPSSNVSYQYTHITFPHNYYTFLIISNLNTKI